MQFAEASQDILTKPTPLKTDFNVGLTPGRRRANQACKKALQLDDIDEQIPATSVPDGEENPSTASGNSNEENSSDTAKRDIPAESLPSHDKALPHTSRGPKHVYKYAIKCISLF